MPLTRARVLDNFVPKGVALEIRKGRSDHVTGITDPVETLMAFNSGSTSKLFAAAGASIFDVTTAGAVGAAVVGSLTNARFSHVNFTTAGGSFLWVCNGADDPRHYNGTTWATPSLTISGFTDNDIFYVWESKQRLFVLFNNSLKFGYLPVTSIAGTVDVLGLGDVFSRGGRLIAGGRLSRDAGDGPDDFTLFLTSEGELAAFAGTNPSSSTEWAKIGAWYIGEPVGDRPMVNLGGDVGIITRNGVVSVMRIMSTMDVMTPESIPYVTGRVSSAFREAVADGVAIDGWEGAFFPAEDVVLINAPAADDTSTQFVRHRITGGWARFTDWNIATMGVFGGKLYAGHYDGSVSLLFDGYNDDGANIVGRISTGWTRLGTASVKTLMEARPVVTVSTLASVRLVGRADYLDSPPLPAWPSSAITNALVWGSGIWGTNLWGGEDATSRQWRAISGHGHAISIAMEARTNQNAFALNGIDIRFEPGGGI